MQCVIVVFPSDTHLLFGGPVSKQYKGSFM